MADDLQKSTTWQQGTPLPSTEDYAKWYTELRGNLEKRIDCLEKTNAGLKKKLAKLESDYNKIIRENLKADIKVKKVYWWILFLGPFVILGILGLTFYAFGNNDKIVNTIRLVIIGLGVSGIIDMLYVSYTIKTLKERLDKLEGIGRD